MTALAIWTRRQITVNTDPQRRCYNGCNFSEDLVWTKWEVLESMRFLKPGTDLEARLKFWQDLNAYSVSVGGKPSEYKLVPEELTP